MHKADRLDKVEEELRQERERAEQYAGILHKLVEGQDEINIEAEKPLHQRSKKPIAKKNEAIQEARQVLEKK